jgi:outer membrane protein OmpA-like peptidoglycan-associated protein
MKSLRAGQKWIFIAAFPLLVLTCQSVNSSMHSRNKSTVQILGFSDDDNDSPSGAVLVSTLSGADPALVLAEQTDAQTVEGETQKNERSTAEVNERITFDSLFVFGKRSDELTPSMIKNLDRIASILKRYPNTAIFIEGYPDTVTTHQQHLSLSEKRAEVIASYLINKKIKQGRIKTRNYGEAQPLFSSRVSEGRIKNRKVQVLIIARSGKTK